MLPSECTAVIVTRGDVDMKPVLESCEKAGFASIVVCDNALRMAQGKPDLGPYGQLEAARTQDMKVVYFQDDDVIVSEPSAVVTAWKPGGIVCNVPQEYRKNYATAPDTLMGFGSVLEVRLILRTLKKYFDAGFKDDKIFLREPGRLLTILNPVEMVDVPITHLPWAHAENRLFRQPDHMQCCQEMRNRAARIIESEKERAVA